MTSPLRWLRSWRERRYRERVRAWQRTYALSVREVRLGYNLDAFDLRDEAERWLTSHGEPLAEPRPTTPGEA